MCRLSKNFTAAEFRCRCGCGRGRPAPALVAALQELRDALDRPVVITSGGRCWIHNARVGGAPGSRHLCTGPGPRYVERIPCAADIRVPGLRVGELYAAVERIGPFASGGVGIYPEHGFVHVDTRGTRARWAVLRRGGPQVGIPAEYAVPAEIPD